MTLRADEASVTHRPHFQFRLPLRSTKYNFHVRLALNPALTVPVN
jgi:hypothetical protein